MPAHHLTPERSPVPPDQMAEAVLAVLSGTSVETAASAIRVDADDMKDAVVVYQAAGYQALEELTSDHGWYLVCVTFSSEWDAVDGAVATGLGPRLDRLQDDGVIDGWWFVREYPCWRLGLHPVDGRVSSAAKGAMNAVLNDAARTEGINRWRPAIYEAGTASLGGLTGRRIAHDLSCVDSRHFLSHMRREPHNRIDLGTLSMRLCATLLSAAGLGDNECGEVWNRVTEWCPLPAETPGLPLAGAGAGEGEAVRSVTVCDAELATPDGADAVAVSWVDAFRDAGHLLQQAAAAGRLTRGLRHVSAHLLLGHWNRLGLSATTQAVLSRAARDAQLPGIGS